MLVRIRAVSPLEGFAVRLAFTDGSERVIDLAPYLCGPVFEPLVADPALFRQVRVDPELGTIVRKVALVAGDQRRWKGPLHPGHRAVNSGRVEVRSCGLQGAGHFGQDTLRPEGPKELRRGSP